MKLSPLFSDGMVLLRDHEVLINGDTTPHSNVTLQFLSCTYQTFSNQSGTFSFQLPKYSAGGPYEMILHADECKTIKDIYIGDVYLLSGQSNMELPIRRTLNFHADRIAHACNNNIRYFTVPKEYQFDAPRQELNGGGWSSVTPETILPMSAVGYYFAQELYDQYKVPIGLIEAAVGGAPIEAFLSENTLQSYPRYDEIIKQNKEINYVSQVIASDTTRMNHWYQQLDQNDLGLQEPKWYRKDLIEEGFQPIAIPQLWRDTALGTIRGSFWFRKTFQMPNDYNGEDATLYLGSLIDSDQAYLNGTLVGKTDYQYPPRVYPIPSGLLKKGENTLTLRLISSTNPAGFVPDKPYGIAYGKQFLNLTGTWLYRIGATCETLNQQTFFTNMPTGLFHGMIYPLRHFSVRGILFYQGESNNSHPEWYEELLKALIGEFRALYQEPNLPFLYVQLANFGNHVKYHSGYQWAYLREAQRKALSLPNTAMIVTLDVGEYNDLHPQNKEAVGKRLALAARALIYREFIPYMGPLISSSRFILKDQNDFLELSFSCADSGLVIAGDEIATLELSEDNVIWTKSTAIVLENKLILPVAKKHPKFVRYAFENHPEGANLYNREGLPASSFLLPL